MSDAGEAYALNVKSGVAGNGDQRIDPPPPTDGQERIIAAEAGPVSEDQPMPSGTDAILDAGRNRALELANLFAAQAGQIPGAASESNKRKFDDNSAADAPDLKRHAADVLGLNLAVASAFFGEAGTVTEVIMCPSDKVGRVIGRSGATIRELEASTSTRVQVDHKAPGEKPVTISGKREDVERANKMVHDLIAGTGDAQQQHVPGEEQRTLECPPGIVGRVIGRGGETIRTLQQASGAHILVNQDFPEGVPRQITISGTQDAVERAASMVSELISGDHANTQAVIQRFGLGSTEVLECPKAMVGRIIGKGGETIKDLQKRFSVSIQIDQSSAPCKITITGPYQSIASAKRAVEDLIRPTNAGPRPGPGPAYGGGFNAPPYSGGASPYGGYGGFGIPPAGYGAPGGYTPYGGYPPYPGSAPPYGGYNAYGAPGADPYANPSGYNASYSVAPAAHQQQQTAPSSQTSAGGGPSIWQALQDDQGRTYYYNTQTGVSQWEKPAEMP